MARALLAILLVMSRRGADYCSFNSPNNRLLTSFWLAAGSGMLVPDDYSFVLDVQPCFDTSLLPVLGSGWCEAETCILKVFMP